MSDWNGNAESVALGMPSISMAVRTARKRGYVPKFSGLSAGRSEGKMLDGETRSKTTDRVECPYCGHENNLNDLYSDLRGPEAATAQCSDCENQFRAIFIVSISVRAVRLEK